MAKEKDTFYKPSWINRFSDWVSLLPGPRLGYFIGIGLIVLMVQAVPAWCQGAMPMGDFLPTHIFLAAAIAFMIGMISYFDDRAKTALHTLKPALNLDTVEFPTITYQLTHLPSSKSIYASVLAILFVLTTELIGGGAYLEKALLDYRLSLVVSRGIYLICWWIFGLFVYHTVHQLKQINQIYSCHTVIDLFWMKPLYGFSNLAALTAGSLLLLPYGFLAVNPEVQMSNPVVLVNYLIISTIGLVTFFLPQLGIHRLQKEEKEHLLAEVNQRYKVTMEEVHQRVDEGEFDSSASLIGALDALTNERKTIEKISTWPWQPETFRWLFTATILPLLMWIAQHFLGRILTP